MSSESFQFGLGRVAEVRQRKLHIADIVMTIVAILMMTIVNTVMSSIIMLLIVVA